LPHFEVTIVLYVQMQLRTADPPSGTKFSPVQGLELLVLLSTETARHDLWQGLISPSSYI